MNFISDIRTQTAHHALPDGQVNLLGAVSEVTPSSTLIEMAGVSLLVDCGAPNHDRGWELPEDAQRAEAVLVTHAHFDHAGGLVDLIAGGFDGPIYATAATHAVARILLRDSVRLEGARSSEVDAFVKRLDELARPVSYDAPVSIEGASGRGVTAFFREAGHILGSASVELESAGSRVIVSGDLGRPNSPILRDANRSWRAHRPVDLVLMESTYGDRVHTVEVDSLADSLEEIINRSLEDGGHILVPSFAIGRVQLLLYLLDKLVEAGRVRNLPVAVDTPMGIRVTEAYQEYRKLYDRESLQKIAVGDDPLDFEHLFAVNRHRDSLRLVDVETPMFIIAGSGMCTGGRILRHLQALLPVPETDVIFVGYQARGTLGRRILEAADSGAEETVRIRGEEIPVRAHVHQLHGLSAHADQIELTDWFGAVPDVEALGLMHGEGQAQEALAAVIIGGPDVL